MENSNDKRERYISYWREVYNTFTILFFMFFSFISLNISILNANDDFVVNEDSFGNVFARSSFGREVSYKLDGTRG